MQDFPSSLKIALVQGTPILFDKKATVRKAAEQILEAGAAGAQLIVFPESYIPCYPYGLTFGFTVGAREESGRKDWKRYYDNALLVPGPETDCIAEAARKTQSYISIGITEREALSCTLYCTNLIFAPDGHIVSHHRKLKPTGAERVIWGDGHLGSFPVVETPWGIAGSLICWENYMPLARATLYQKGVSLYLAPNTNNNTEWQDTVRHIGIEGRCFVFNVNQYFRRADYPKDLHCPSEIAALPEEPCSGGSCLVDPYGHYVIAPVWGKEVLLYAEIDPNVAAESRMEFDVAGHYSRPDVISLNLQEE